MVLTYTEDAALGRSGVLTVDKDTIKRHKAPVIDAYAIPYSAYILNLMEVFFQGKARLPYLIFKEKHFGLILIFGVRQILSMCCHW